MVGWWSHSDVALLVAEQMDKTRVYAEDAVALSTGYIDELNNYIVGTITTTVPPPINIPTSDSITIDPSLVGLIPVAPADSAYPVVPSAPSTSDHNFPNAPTYTVPNVPTMHDIVLPEFIEMAIDQPTMSLPLLDFEVPSTAQINDGGLTPEDALAQAAKARLINNITNGGTMLNPQVEADIWNRDLERNEQALQDAVDKLTTQWAKLGWSVPDGLLSGSLLGLNNEYMNKKLDRSREIAVKQAELEQSGMFKSLELAIQLEKILIDSLNDYARRVFETSKATADVTIALLKARIDRYNSLLAAFKADMDAYKTNIEAEMQRAEVYKTRLTGLQILSGIDETAVKIYTTKISAIGQFVDIYKTGVQAVSAMYEAEKQKIEMFKSKVDAYTSVVKSITEKYATQVEGFKSYLSAWTASSDSQTKLIDIGVRAQIAETEATLKEWEVQLRLIQENTSLKLEALKAVAQTASNLAAGAMSAAHTSASAAFTGIDQLNISGQG
jgi:hypothetical protein